MVADDKFYLANMVLAEVSGASSSSYKHSEANNLQISKTNVLTKANEENNQGGKHHVDGASKKNGTPLLRYVPKVKKNEESALNGLTLLVVNLNEVKVAPPLKGFV